MNNFGKVTSNLFFFHHWPFFHHRPIEKFFLSLTNNSFLFFFFLFIVSFWMWNRLGTPNIPIYDQLKGIWGATTQLPISLVPGSHVCQMNRIWAALPQLDIWALQLPRGPHVARNVSLNLRWSQGKEKWQESVWYLTHHPMWPPVPRTFVASQKIQYTPEPSLCHKITKSHVWVVDNKSCPCGTE